MSKLSLFVPLTLFFVACASIVTPKTAFNEQETSWVLKPGKNTIWGQPFARTVGGELRTCAGAGAELYPKSTYSTERMKFIFGENLDQYARSVILPALDKNYEKLVRVTICDITGKFKFENVPDGTYYLTASVSWMANSQQGGRMLKEVSVKSGQILEESFKNFSATR